MKSILWLPSWYPNRLAPFDGDFIQRMARATAAYDKVFVLFVAEEQLLTVQEEAVVAQPVSNLTEQIVYFPTPELFAKATRILRYLRIYKRYIDKYIAEFGKPDVVHVQVPIKAGLLALWLKRKYKVPFVVTEHYGIYNDIVEDKFSSRSYLFKYYTRRIISQGSSLQAVSRFIGESINRLVVKKHFEVIYNTVDVNLFRFTPAKRNLFRFLHVSNMIPLKNVKGIIRASVDLLRTGASFELVIVGPYPPGIFEFARDTGYLGSSIFFTGEISYPDVALQMQSAHSLILFSDIENMPCVVLEALCSGLPVIASRVGGIPEVVDNENGMLIEPRDERSLQSAMADMIRRYHLFDGARISKNAQALFSYETIGRKISESYKA